MIYDFEKIEKQFAHNKTQLMFYLMMTNNTKIKRLNKEDKEYILNKIIRTYNEMDETNVFSLIDFFGENISDIIRNDMSALDIINKYEAEYDNE